MVVSYFILGIIGWLAVGFWASVRGCKWVNEDIPSSYKHKLTEPSYLALALFGIGNLIALEIVKFIHKKGW